MTNRADFRQQQCLLSALTAFMLVVLAPAPGEAQVVFRACYVPDVGLVYRIGEAGLPTACQDPSHVEFSWNEGGDGSITTAQLADGAVTQAKLDSGVTLGVGPGDIGSTEIADGAVTAAKLDPSITLGVGPGDIGTTEIADGAVTAVKISAGEVWDFGGGDGSIRLHGTFGADVDGRTLLASFESNVHLAPQVRFDGSAANTWWDFGLNPAGDFVFEFEDIDQCTLHTGGVGWSCPAAIPADAIGSTEVLDNSLTASDLGVGSVGTSEVADNSLTASDLAAGSVAASELAAGAVTPAHILAGQTWDFGGTSGSIRLHGGFSGGGGKVLLSSWESSSFNGPQARFQGAAGGWWDFGLDGNGDFVIERNDAAACTITVGSLSWACTSDRDMKADFAEIDASEVLESIASLQIQSWSYRGAPSVRHAGPVAQDFFEAFHLGDDETKIGLLDATGISMLAIQALEARTDVLAAENARLRAEMQTLIEVVEAMSPSR